MKKSLFYRGLYYVAGLLLLALGISLNTRSGLGVSPIISVSYSISSIWNLNFGDMTFILYGIFVLVEMCLHTVRSKIYAHRGGPALAHANRINLKLVLVMDVLQLPLSLVFTRFLNLFQTGSLNLGPHMQAVSPAVLPEGPSSFFWLWSSPASGQPCL